MGLIGDIFKGMILLSFLALFQEGFSIKKMAIKAVEAHQKGLTSYGKFSRELTGHKGSFNKGQSD